MLGLALRAVLRLIWLIRHLHIPLVARLQDLNGYSGRVLRVLRPGRRRYRRGSNQSDRGDAGQCSDMVTKAPTERPISNANHAANLNTRFPPMPQP